MDLEATLWTTIAFLSTFSPFVLFPIILRVRKHDQCNVDGDITVIVQVCPEP